MTTEGRETPPSCRPRCLLFDGHGLLYRAFFALPVMTARDGRHTHALLGFVRMLQQLLRCWSPTHAAVAFDAGLPDKRMRLLESYKAQRPPMPATLREQIDYVLEYLCAAAIPVVSVAGEEADDVIASLIERLPSDDAPEILIVSSDKDLFQLTSSRVALISPTGKPSRTDAAEVLRKTGVEPSQIVDWLALIGDSADNIPGVPGIGPKTAARLLQEHGKLETLWQHLDTIRPESIQSALRENRELVTRNVELMTLRRDLAVEPRSWQELECRTPPRSALEDFFNRYDMKSLAPEKTQTAKPEEQGMLGLTN